MSQETQMAAGKYDPQVDLSKMEGGFVDLLNLVRENDDFVVPNNLRRELSQRYREIVEQNPALVLKVINKLDAKYKADENFKSVLEAVLSGDYIIPVEVVQDTYYKSLMLGDLMMEAGDYRRAEAYLFVALKIEDMQGKKLDPCLIIDFAEAVYCNVDPKAYKPISKDGPKYKKFSSLRHILKEKARVMFFLSPIGEKENDISLVQEERLDIAKNLLFSVLAQDSTNVDALELLSEIFMEYAAQYIKLVKDFYKRPVRNFSKNDINYVEYNFEEAMNYAMQVAIYSQEDEMDGPDLALYSDAARQLAVFLAEAGETKKAMSIFRDLLERNTDPIATRNSLVSVMMPSIIMWKDIRNEDLENHRRYIGLRNMAKSFLDEIINYVDYQMADSPSDEDLLMYISAHYNRALILLWDGSYDEVRNTVTIIRGINHPDAESWADELEEHIEYQRKKDLKNPRKS